MSAVEKKDRDKAAELIASWLSSNITNYELDDQWDYDSKDCAVADIGKELWRHYSDSPEYRLKVSYLSTEEQLLLKRCLSFLQSEEKYLPVAYEVEFSWKPNFISRLFGVKEPPWEAMRLNIPLERQKWWPFADQAQCEKIMGKSAGCQGSETLEGPKRPRWLKWARIFWSF